MSVVEELSYLGAAEFTAQPIQGSTNGVEAQINSSQLPPAEKEPELPGFLIGTKKKIP